MLSALTRILDRWHGRRDTRPSDALAQETRQPAVVVTGASAGIGQSIALRFAAAGHAVVLVARDVDRLDAAADSLRRDGYVDTHVLALDIADLDAPSRLESFLSSRDMYLDVLVNNAGIGAAGPFSEAASERIEELVASNVAGLTRLTRTALPAMLARRRGGIINVASLGGFAPGPYQAAYYASKAYVISLTEAVAAEVAGKGVRVMVVAPGPVETRFHEKMGADRSFYRWWVPAMSPDAVAREVYLGYRLWQRVVVPGLVPKVFAVALRVLPHAVTVPIIGLLLAPRR